MSLHAKMSSFSKLNHEAIKYVGNIYKIMNELIRIYILSDICTEPWDKISVSNHSKSNLYKKSSKKFHNNK